MKAVTINEDQKLFCIPAGDGFSSLGFDVCLARTQAYAAAMGETLAIQPLYGTLEAYELYRQIEQRFCQHPAAAEAERKERAERRKLKARVKSC